MTMRGVRQPDAPAASFTERFARDVEFYLSQDPRQLPSRYLYDDLGSALFEAICRLPWYPLTRGELALLAAHARGVFARLSPVSTIVELGAGSGEKLALLLGGATAEGARLRDVHLVDISPSALAQAARAVEEVADVRVVTHAATYESGLDAFARTRGQGRALAFFLGSNVGNYDPPAAEALLRAIRAALSPGDALLIGADLVKPERDLLLAYDDPLQVTAAFNRNLLVRINRELRGTFDLGAFAHRAVWNEADSRVEMHLVSLRDQRVVIGAAGLDLFLRRGETIWTESSYKFQAEQVIRLLERAGFRLAEQWVDERSRFALTLSLA
jgi:L-histidine N-alpha-methyltransferase